MRFARNLGLLTLAQQNQLAKSHVVVSGVGGMGGIAAEAMVRMGVGTITVLDHDTYEISNINRQIHCTEKSIGRPKVDVVVERLLDINPSLNVRKFHELSVENALTILRGSDIVINGMDDIKASIILERAARKLHITIVDAWITPYASVFVMTPKGLHWEEFLDFPTQAKQIEEITEVDVKECLRREVKFTLSQFSPTKIIDKTLIEEILAGRIARPSLVPVVWLSGTLMANEAMKILTNQGRLATHWGVFYNQYDHEIKYIEVPETKKEKEHEHRLNHFKLAG